MAIPAQFQKHSPSPGDRAAGKSSAPKQGPSESPQHALHVLEGAVHSTQAKAALKTIEADLGGASEKAQSRPAKTSSSPGMKAAQKYLK